MESPADRPLRRLPQLAPRKGALELCVYCPKLCRSACPVSNAEPRETLTPWGKMSLAYFAANDSVAVAPTFAAPAWACTGCFACRSSCDHRNDVAATLFDARSALREAGVAPAAATGVLERFDAHANQFRQATAALASRPRVRPRVRGGAKAAVLVGCHYARRAPHESEDAVLALQTLLGAEVELIDLCCGAPLLHAGDRRRFLHQGELLVQAVKHTDRLVVVDAGCATTILHHHVESGLVLPTDVELFVDHAARDLGRIEVGGANLRGPVRWHDPCQLARGLEVRESPRAVLSRVLGRAPDEFVHQRDRTGCSGAGALLPLTMPEVSRAITDARIAEHTELGGGTIVTACASSLRAFRRRGATAIDLVSVVARALGIEAAPP